MGLLILYLLGLAVLSPLLHWRIKLPLKITPAIALSALSSAVFIWLALQIPRVADAGQIIERSTWIGSLGIEFHFTLDGLSLLMALLISGIGVLVLAYGGDYLHGQAGLPRFLVLILLFMAAMLGVVLSGNALLLFVFWELTSITSFLLIGYDHHRESARTAAWQALLVTGGGGLAMFAGLLMMGQITSSYDLQVWASMAGEIQRQPAAVWAFILILLGAMTKSAIFPFHFWLPNAMEAPTPVSAYLHSATMVKAGLYLMARLLPAFSGLILWQPLLVTFGVLTTLAGALLSLGQSDLKKLLAYSTVSSLGTIFFLLGIGTPLAVKSAAAFLLGHALYKGALFLTAGSVDHGAGTRDIRRLGGLARAMPFTAAAGGVAALSMAGLPPLFGFISKELVYESLLAFPQWNILLVVLVLLAFAMTTAVAGWVGILPFWTRSRADLHPHESSPWLWAPPVLLATLGLVLGLLPSLPAVWIIGPAASAIMASPQTVKLSLWHGFNLALGLSGLTLLLAGALYLGRTRVSAVAGGFFSRAAKLGPDSLYRQGLNLLLWLAAFLTRVLQNGYLRNYVATVIITVFALVGLTLARWGIPIQDGLGPWPRFYDVILVVMILVATLVVVQLTSRLAVIAILGSIGFSIALLFLLYSAPDLAMVQFAIETLTVIMFVLVIYRLPKFARLTGRKTRSIDAGIALLGGAVMTVLMLIVSSHPSESLLAPFFLANSQSQAFGNNVVNVILVDFRGLDTLGEITVLAVASIGVYALLRLVRRSPEPQAITRKDGTNADQ